jgi:hypothetical protein
MKSKYGIQDEDTYNFDETGFMMGVISSQMVVTASDRRGKRKIVQPGNREWVTVIQGINACGWAIPPFIIYAGKIHISSWYQDTEIPRDWVLGVSDNGWTTNQLGVAWLKHFDRHTAERTAGSRRLLIIDGHESHKSMEFQEICKEKNIITLCMPPHSSHLLQPLDVGCFAPLKRAYGDQIGRLARNHINYITKLEFLPAFKAAFKKSFTKENICSSFRGAGLVPLDPEVVVSKLDVHLRTPTPPRTEDTLWEPKTPSNTRELKAQSTLINESIERSTNSLPTSLQNAIKQYQKGAELLAHELVLMKDENTALRKANDAATKRRSRKRNYIQKGGILTIEDAQEIIASEVPVDQEDGERPAKRVRTERHCGRCGKIGHDARTCQ